MPRQVFRWKSRPALAGAPAFLHPWLADPASLTARIVARCDKFQVRVLRETRAPPFLDEYDIIDLPLQRHAWMREVLLIADGVPVVFAHSILSPRDLTGAWHMARAIAMLPQLSAQTCPHSGGAVRAFAGLGGRCWSPKFSCLASQGLPHEPATVFAAIHLLEWPCHCGAAEP
jgi:hypothetical protein